MMRQGCRHPPVALLIWGQRCFGRVVTASAVFGPPPLNEVRNVVVLIRSVQATPSVLECKER